MSDNPFGFPFPSQNQPDFIEPLRPSFTPAAPTRVTVPTAATPALPPLPPLDRLEAAMAWIRRIQKSRVGIEKETMAQWAMKVRFIFKDIFGESSPMVKQIEMWRLALIRGNTAKFQAMVDDVEERLETLLDMTEGDGLTLVGQFLPRTFVSFSSADIGRFRMMQAWTKNEHIPFNFYNCQLKEAIKSGNSDYVKRRCRRRIKLASKLIVLIGSDTYTKEKFVKPEVEAAVEKNCAIIGVNLDQNWQVNQKLTPSFVRDIGAVFVPFSPQIIQFALATYQANPAGDYIFSEAIYQREGYRIVGDKAVFQKR